MIANTILARTHTFVHDGTNIKHVCFTDGVDVILITVSKK